MKYLINSKSAPGDFSRFNQLVYIQLKFENHSDRSYTPKFVHPIRPHKLNRNGVQENTL